MGVTWVDVASLVLLAISSGATIWVAIAAYSTSKSAAKTAERALEKSESRASRGDRLAMTELVNEWANDIAHPVVHGKEQATIPRDLAIRLSAVDGSEPIVVWYRAQVNALVAAYPGTGTTATRERIRREGRLRVHLAKRAAAWVKGDAFDTSSIDPATLWEPK